MEINERAHGFCQVKNRKTTSFLFFLALAAMVPFNSAHLDSGFDQTSGPYTFDLGWSPSAPTAGESTLLALNVLDARTGQGANIPSAWVRFDQKDRVAFAGTLSLENGSTSFSYSFPSAGIWTVSIQAGGASAKGEIRVPQEAPTNETWAWLIAGILALLAAGLTYRAWKKQK